MHFVALLVVGLVILDVHVIVDIRQPQQMMEDKYVKVNVLKIGAHLRFTSLLAVPPPSPTICEAQRVGLVAYPATPAPSSGTRTVATQCADNAHRTSSTLNVQCSSAGTWSGSPQCQCNSGYQTATVSGRQICQGRWTQQIEHMKYTLFIPLAVVEVTICDARIDGLVRYNATLAPASGSVTVTTQCADNAHRTSSSLNAFCSSTGSWSGNPRCACNSGYQTATADGGRQICQGKCIKNRCSLEIYFSTSCSTSFSNYM